MNSTFDLPPVTFGKADLFSLRWNVLLLSVATELAEYQEKVTDASIYYKEAFGITPEQALENEEKLRQMEELVASLDAEVGTR